MHGHRATGVDPAVAAATNHFPQRQIGMLQRSGDTRQQQLLGSAVAVPDGDRPRLPRQAGQPARVLAQGSAEIRHGLHRLGPHRQPESRAANAGRPLDIRQRADRQIVAHHPQGIVRDRLAEDEGHALDRCITAYQVPHGKASLFPEPDW
ncbi:hypothetical protein D9M68_688320 [compost metagenome]